MKKSLLIIILILAGFAAWYFLRDTSSGTSDKNKTEFNVDNIEDVYKIFLSNKAQGNLLLEKKGNIWYVNGKYEVFKPTIQFFLEETVKKIRVLGPVPLPARENVIASMASIATKVEIYRKNGPDKIYYVGQPTADMTGTYMYLQGSKDPYITHVPGFDGFLSSRYPVDEDEWISKVIFDYKPEEIKSVEVLYPDNVDESFTISRQEKLGNFEIVASENAPAGKLNYAAVKSYFALFGNKYCEGFETVADPQRDSILKLAPYTVIKLTDSKKNISTLKIYKRLSSDRDHGLFDKDGNRLVFDPSRYYAIMNNDTRIMVIQDIMFGPILIHYSDFILKN